MYWYALKSFRKNKEELNINDIHKYFTSYHTVVKELIASTKKDRIHKTEITDSKPTKQRHQDYVFLIEDAAHAATPYMVEGTFQAI
ncbi:MAG: 2-polyprenyl-6-methoxyphenol hydroxylase-like FAD-dependent oxidoreductase [Parvicella sp.]